MKNKKVLTISAVIIFVFIILFVGVILPWINDVQKTADEEQVAHYCRSAHCLYQEQMIREKQTYDACVEECKFDVSAKFASIINVGKLNMSECNISSFNYSFWYTYSYNIKNELSFKYEKHYSTRYFEIPVTGYSFKLNISEPFKHKELFNDSFASLFPECWDGKEEGCKERICEHIYSVLEKGLKPPEGCNVYIDSSGREYLYVEDSYRT